jgi:hypothetical protein
LIFSIAFLYGSLLHTTSAIQIKFMEPKKKLTTASGIPYAENENSMTAGPRGPILLQDFILHEKMAHFNRERIPERVVHAKGSGAYGTLTITHDITKYTRAKVFSAIGKQTKLFLRFSTVGGEKAAPIPSAIRVALPLSFIPKMVTGIWWVTTRLSSLLKILKSSAISSTLKNATHIPIAKALP